MFKGNSTNLVEVAMCGLAKRCGEGEALAAHTLTEALLPTTCVVVNKPPAL